MREGDLGTTPLQIYPPTSQGFLRQGRTNAAIIHNEGGRLQQSGEPSSPVGLLWSSDYTPSPGTSVCGSRNTTAAAIHWERYQGFPCDVYAPREFRQRLF